MKDLSLELYLSHLRDAVILIASDGTPLIRNGIFDIYFGIRGGNFNNLFDVLHQNPLIVAHIKKVAETRGSYFLRDVAVVLHGGQKGMDIETFPIVSLEGELLAIHVSFHDRKMGAGNFDEHQKRIDRIQYLATIASGLAHEIKNPLSGIKGASQLLSSSLKDQKELAEYAQIIQREVVRVDRLLKDLLHFTKPRSLQKRPANLNKILHDLVVLQKTVSPSQVNFLENFDPSLPFVSVDEDALSQVFLNLIKNARQAIEKKGEVVVSSHMVTNYLLKVDDKKRQVVGVDIKDNGEGIDEESINNIFVPFYTTKSGGTGLGLALCHQIVEEHGGSIVVKSEKGRGSMFSVYLPV